MWEVKHVRGALVDAEVIAQYLLLRHAAVHPAVIRANTSAALAALADAGYIARAVAEELIAALRLWRHVQGMLKLLLGEGLDEATAPAALKAVLARGADAVDFAGLKLDIT